MKFNISNSRSRYQFILRTMFVVATIASVVFGWLCYKVRQAQQQKTAVEAIKNLRGTIMYDYEVDQDGEFHEDDPKLPAPIWLIETLGDDFFVNVTKVEVSDRFTDNDLIHLQGLPTLTCLILKYAHVTDSGLAHIQGFPQLLRLDLTGTQITNAGLAHLQ